MNHYKQLGKNRKKDELPSFLVGLTDAPEDITFAPKPSPSTHYLGPIFVGLCTNYQHHAPPHSLKLGSFHHPQFTMLPGADDISKLLYPHTRADKITQTVYRAKPVIKRQRTFRDIYPHKCTGSKRMFIPDVKPHIIDLGKTPSTIEGEASYEIPLSRSRHLPPRYRRKSLLKRDNDHLTLSDIREERRLYMTYKDRIAHAHFPKEFTTVTVIGPTIPASITITKLPSKRKTQSLLESLERKSDTGKGESADEIQKTRSRAIKSRSTISSTSKKSSSRSFKQKFEELGEADEEIELHGEFYDEFHSVEGEEGEIEGLGEIEYEKLEDVEDEKDEDDEDRGDSKSEIKQGSKKSIRIDSKRSIKVDSKKSIKEESKKSIKADSKKSISIKEDITRESKKSIRDDNKQDSKKSIKSVMKQESKKSIKSVLKQESKKSIKSDKQESKKSISIKEDIKQESKKSIKDDVKQESKKSISIKEDIKQESKKSIKDEKQDSKKSIEIKEEPKTLIKDEAKRRAKEERKRAKEMKAIEAMEEPKKDQLKKIIKDEHKRSVKDDMRIEFSDEPKKSLKDERVKSVHIKEEVVIG